jgi:hypothetical protein
VIDSTFESAHPLAQNIEFQWIQPAPRGHRTLTEFSPQIDDAQNAIGPVEEGAQLVALDRLECEPTTTGPSA